MSLDLKLLGDLGHEDAGMLRQENKLRIEAVTGRDRSIHPFRNLRGRADAVAPDELVMAQHAIAYEPGGLVKGGVR